MSRLDELIQELCPDGVEYKTLGELGKFYGGITGKSKDDFTDGNAKFITYKNVYSNPALDIDVDDKVKIGDDENQRTLEYGDIIFTGSSETPDECGISSVLTQQTDEKLYLNSFCFVFRFDDTSIMLPDFSKHLFRSSEIRYQIGKTANGVTRFNVSKKQMRQVKIPVPPLEVQREIVRILDSFTLLTAELTAELTARQKQYAFYRDYLLDFSNEDVTKKIPDIDCSNIKYVKLGDISKIVRGASPRPIKNFITTSSTGINWIKIGDVNINSKYITETKEKITQEGATKSRYVRKGDFILSNSMSFGRPYILEIDGCIHDGWLSISEFEKYVTADYLYYYLISNKLQKEMKQRASFGGAVQNLNADIVRDLEIAVPPLSVQENIVKILDRFDKLNNDMSEGLPAEIEARKKQYEYYRDTLLSFDDKACSHIVKVERERERANTH